jgi:hypothetical protein
MTPLLIPILLSATRFVDSSAPPNGNGQTWTTAYNTIQEALRDENSTEILVADGRYTGPLLIPRPLSIRGGFGGETQIRGQGFTNTVQTSHNLALQDLTINDSLNSAILAENCFLFINSCLLYDNLSSQRGGSVYAENSTVFIFDSLLSGQANYGGAAEFLNSTSFLYSCTIAPSLDGNTLGADGLNIRGGESTIISCKFVELLGEDAGALAASEGAKVCVLSSHFKSNTSTNPFLGASCGVAYSEANLTFSNCFFSENSRPLFRELGGTISVN